MANKREVRSRVTVLLNLGGCCAACGTTNLRLLQIDHRDGGGHQERIKDGLFGKGLVRAILSGARATDDLQLLCANCHQLKTYSSEHWDDVVQELTNGAG
jgi:5-methylcytosine-specific restriction endonuclease McrA